MKFLVIINSMGLLAIYLLYRLFNWLLIERVSTSEMDRSSCKPNFFISESKKLVEKDIEDRSEFALTEISNDTQLFDKTTRNGLIKDHIDLFDDKKTIL